MKRYIIIDDVRSARTLLNEVLDSEGGINAEGYTLDIARTYDEGLTLLLRSLVQQPYNLLLLDHDLGLGLTGYDLLRKILDYCIDENGDVLGSFLHLPKEIKCVSSNPAGRAKIEHLIETINELKRI